MFKVGGIANPDKIYTKQVVDTAGAKKICVRAYEDHPYGAYYTKALTITVNPSPTEIVLAPSAVAQGAESDTLVGTLTTTGGTNPYTYSLVNDAIGGTGACAAGDFADNASFKVGAGANADKILTNATVTTGAKKICVRATDSAVPAANYTKALTITVNPPPTNIVLEPSAVAVGTLTNNVVGTLTTTGGAGTITYSLVDNATGGMGTCVLGTDNINNAMFQVGAGHNLGKILTNAPVTTGDKKICVRATDSATPAAYYTKNIIITVNNLPTNITLAPSAIGEGAAANAVVGTLTTTDPESGWETFTYSLVTAVGTGGGTCAAVDYANNGMFQVGLSGGNLDKIYTKATVTPGAKKICVRSTDNGAGSLYYTKAITIAVNAAPTALVLGTPFINQGAAADTTVGTLTPTGGTGPYTYLLVNNTTGGTGTCAAGDFADNASYKIGECGYADKVLTNAVVATTGTKKICVRVTDSASPATYRTQAITITVNAAPTNVALAPSGVMVGTLTNIVVGTLTKTGGAGTITYTLVNNATGGMGACAAGNFADNAMFQVGAGANSGKILTNATVTTGAKKICVRATDSATPAAYYTKPLTITTNNPPTNITLSASTVAENSAYGTAIGNLTTTDPDAGETFIYSLVTAPVGTCVAGDSADNTKVQIATAALKVYGGIDYETQTTLKICVQTTNAAVPADKFQKAFTITVTDANDAPTNITLAPSAIGEGAAANAVVGTLTTTDPDAGQTFAYSLVTAVGTGGGACAAGDSVNNGMFKIGGGSSDQILVNTTVTAGAKMICVRSTDNGAGSLYYTKKLTITVYAPPTPQSPSGAVYTGNPVFTWTKPAGATQYALYVYTNATPSVVKFANYVTPTCGTSTCSYTPTLNLTAGNYKWAVKAGNNFGDFGAYSTWLNFTASAPAAPTPQLPSGAIYSGNPAFTWTRPAGATQYALYVYTNATPSVVIFASSAITPTCGTTTCSYTPTLNLTAGSYKWAVKAGNTIGWSAYSTWLNFTPSAPAAPTALTPSGPIATGNPTFTWTRPAGVTQYALYVYTNATPSVVKFATYVTPTCNASTCSYAPTLNLTAGNYKWAVKAGNTAGWSAYSTWITFTVSN
jgi:hypothetical protein